MKEICDLFRQRLKPAVQYANHIITILIFVLYLKLILCCYRYTMLETGSDLVEYPHRRQLSI